MDGAPCRTAGLDFHFETKIAFFLRIPRGIDRPLPYGIITKETSQVCVSTHKVDIKCTTESWSH